MAPRILLRLALPLLLLVGTSCSSLANVPDIYGGTRADLQMLGDSAETRRNIPLALIELPISLAVDTALAPVTFLVWLFSSGDEDEPRTRGGGSSLH